MLIGLVVTQWLHVLAAIIWMGVQIYTAVVIWPTMLRQPAGEARVFFDAMAEPARRLMAPAGTVLLVTGLLRGTWLGPVRGVDFLLTTPYGLTFLASMVLIGVLMATTGGPPQRVYDRIWDGDRYRPGAEAFLRRKNAVSLGLLAALLGCMVLMRFGL